MIGNALRVTSSSALRSSGALNASRSATIAMMGARGKHTLPDLPYDFGVSRPLYCFTSFVLKGLNFLLSSRIVWRSILHSPLSPTGPRTFHLWADHGASSPKAPPNLCQWPQPSWRDSTGSFEEQWCQDLYRNSKSHQLQRRRWVQKEQRQRAVQGWFVWLCAIRGFE